MIDTRYPRDLCGYRGHPPDAAWPGGARIAVQFVVNYEEGAENCVLHGDAASEAFLSEIVGATPIENQRHMNMESLYEYGSRAGFWRLHRLFVEREFPITVFGVAMALQRNPEAVVAMQEANWEIASHGYRWIDYQSIEEDTEREHLRKAIEIHTELVEIAYYDRSPDTFAGRLENLASAYKVRAQVLRQPARKEAARREAILATERAAASYRTVGDTERIEAAEISLAKLLQKVPRQ